MPSAAVAGCCFWFCWLLMLIPLKSVLAGKQETSGKQERNRVFSHLLFWFDPVFLSISCFPAYGC
jgi:hypothetical protein